MRKLFLTVLFLLSWCATAGAQLSLPLRILNSGTTLPLEYKLNFVNGGCVNNPGAARIDCTIGGSGGGQSVTAPITGDGSVGTPLSCPTCVTLAGVQTLTNKSWGDNFIMTGGPTSITALQPITDGGTGTTLRLQGDPNANRTNVQVNVQTAAYNGDIFQLANLGVSQLEFGNSGNITNDNATFVVTNISGDSIVFSGGAVFLRPNGVSRFQLEPTRLILSPAAASGGAANVNTALTINGSVLTNQIAATELPDVNFAFNRSVTFNTSNLTNQRQIKLLAATYNFNAASVLTNAANLYVDNPPIQGTNSTETNAYGAWFDNANPIAGAANAINRAATVYIAGAPTAGGGGGSIANPYALLLDGGGVDLADATISQQTNINTNVVINGASGVITTQTATTAARTSETGFTVTNNCVKAASVVIVSVVGYSGTLFTNGQPDAVVTSITGGSFNISVVNRDATNALSGTMKIHFTVL